MRPKNKHQPPEMWHKHVKIVDWIAPKLEFILLKFMLILAKYLPQIVIDKVMPLILGKPTKFPVHQVFPYENTLKFLDALEKIDIPIWIGTCICRRARNMYCEKGEGYNVTDMVIGDYGVQYSKYHPDAFQRITYPQAKKYIKKFYEAGLVQTIFNECPGRDTQAIICNCDRDVCVPMYCYRKTGFQSFYKSPYKIIQIAENCQGCKECISVCPVGARSWNDTISTIKIDHDKCIGCGLCRNTCKNDAIQLKRDKNQNFVVIEEYQD
ncbi:MAG: 4Fe-4S dicluster domain-containing protein [Candidatus Lokiarchaeota archaeon]|nr:4Fe-4S dicluster domain-containing protein [Candidatus Lokiarchaeota archaeon]